MYICNADSSEKEWKCSISHKEDTSETARKTSLLCTNVDTHITINQNIRPDFGVIRSN